MWSKLASAGGPIRKQEFEMISYRNSLLLFGGLGTLSGLIQPGSEFAYREHLNDGSGRTNELHCFVLSEGKNSILAFHEIPQASLGIMMFQLATYHTQLALGLPTPCQLYAR